MTNSERIKMWASGAYKVVILFLYVIGVIGVAVAGVLGSKKALEIFRTLIE